MDDELRKLEIEKCKLEIAHLKRPLFLDLKFILPFSLSLFLAWFAYDEREQKELSQNQLSKAEHEASNLAQDLDTVIDKQRQLAAAETTTPDDRARIEELSQEFSVALANVSQSRTKAQRAKALERSGILAILDRDIDGALEAFDNAHEVWPDYHNVSEIRHWLTSRQEKLRDRDSPYWQRLYRTIVDKYSWGLDQDLLTKLRLAAVGRG